MHTVNSEQQQQQHLAAFHEDSQQQNNVWTDVKREQYVSLASSEIWLYNFTYFVPGQC
jgi:hypothetical protein